MKNIIKLTSISIIASTGNTLCQTTSGETENIEEAEIEFLDTTVVTGDKFKRAVYDIPGSTSILDGERLLRHATGTERSEVLERTANATSLSGALSAFTIRGISDQAFTPAFTTDSNTLSTVFHNQIPLSASSVNFLSPTLWDVNQVEVLRGAQSVYHGPNSLAGAVFYNYRRPDFNYSGKARMEYGGDGLFNFGVAQNIPLIDEKLALRIAFERTETDGYVRNITRNEDFGARRARDIHTQLLWRPGGNDDAVFNFSYRYADATGSPIPLHGTQTSLFERTATYDAPTFTEAEGHYLSLEGDILLNDFWRLSSVTGAQFFNLDFADDPDFSALDTGVLNRFSDQNLFTQELRLNYDSDRLKGGVGLYGSYNEYEGGFNGSTGSGQADVSIVDEGLVGAVFGNLEYSITDRLSFGAGLRLNYEKRESSNNSTLNIPGFFSGSGASSDDEDFFEVLPALNGSYEIADGQKIGFLASRGYRSGGVSVAPFLSQSNAFDQESTLNYELFYRGRFLDDRLSLNSNVFYLDWKDQQVGTNLAGGIPGIDTQILNAGDSNAYGAEMELAYSISDNWSLSGSVGYSKTEFSDFEIAPGSNLKGEAFPYAPEFNTSLSLAYESENGFFGNATWSWVDDSYGDVNNPSGTSLASRNLLSAKLGYGKDNWKVYVFASNILDENYAVSNFDISQVAAANPTVNSAYGQASRPRLLGVGLELEW